MTALPSLPEHNTTAVVFRGSQTLVLRVQRITDGGRRIAKVRGLGDDPDGAERLRHEGRIVQSLRGRRFPRYCGLVPFQDGLALLMEDDDAIALDTTLQEAPVSIDRFLDTAIGATEALSDLHRQGFVHGDIKPNNILVKPHSGQVFLCDFDRTFGLEAGTDAGVLRMWEGTHAYLAPEQTGRISRPIDHRADLYGLGATLYHLLTGTPPVEPGDALSVLHQQLAVMPQPPHEVVAGVPPQLSRIVLKLLAKNAEDRYASAHGLLADLRRAKLAWLATGELRTFQLAEQDRPTTFLLPDRLYGRDPQRNRLLAAWERVRSGRCELVIVSGSGGSGKSSLVQSIAHEVRTDGGRFIGGKFEAMRSDVPYTGLVEALRALGRDLLSSAEDGLVAFRKRVRDVLGDHVALLSELVPDLASALAVQDALPEVDPSEERARFRDTMLAFLSVVASESRPVVIFLDDLHWADPATLRLLELLFDTRTDTDRATARLHHPEHLLIIGSVRPEEIDASHPVVAMQRALQAQGPDLVTQVHVPPLTEDDASQLLQDALMLPAGAVAPAANLATALTRGNAFMLRRLFTRAARAGHLRFSPEGTQWLIDVDGLRTCDPGSDVSSILGQELRELPDATQRALQVGAALGVSFRTDDLSELLGVSSTEVEASLRPALRIGFVLPCPGRQDTTRLRFMHDRVRQCAWDEIPPDRRTELHLRIGRVLLQRHVDTTDDEGLAELVHHFVLGGCEDADPVLRRRLAPIFRRAGNRARVTGAWQAAGEHLSRSCRMLGEEAWTNDPGGTWSVHLDYAEACYLSNDFITLRRLLASLRPRALSPAAAVRLDVLHVMSLVAQDDWSGVMSAARRALIPLGIVLPEFPSQWAVVRGLIQSRWRFRHGIRHLLHAPDLTDEATLGALKLIQLCQVAALLAAPPLTPILAFTSMQLIDARGKAAELATSAAHWAIVLVAALDDLNRAEDAIHTAHSYLDAYPSRTGRGRLLLSEAGYVRHWTRPLLSCADDLDEAFRLSLRAGDPLHAAMSAATRALYLLLGGAPLQDVDEVITDLIDPVGRCGFDHPRDDLMRYRQAVRNLRGDAEDVLTLRSDDYDIEADSAHQVRSSGKMSIAGISLLQMLVCLTYGDVDGAWRATKAAHSGIASVAGSAWGPLFTTMQAVTALRAAGRPGGPAPRTARRIARRALRKLRGWHQRQPALYDARIAMIQGEFACARGRPDQALQSWESAIASPSDALPLFERAWILERAGRVAMDSGRRISAAALLREACRSLHRWGARVAAERIEASFGSQLHSIPAGSRQLPEARSAHETGPVGQTDLDVVVRGSHAISKHLRLDGLVRELLGLIRQASGAQRALLVLRTESGDEIIEDTPSEALGTLKRSPLMRSDDIPLPMILSVLRTGDAIVLGNAARVGAFTAEPCVRRRKLGSVLVAPMYAQGEVVGVVYLENNLLHDAFDGARLDTVRMLAVQAGISLRNALLVEELEARVRDRTRELQDARDHVERLLRNILPDRVANELKERGSVAPVQVPSATVLFTDFCGFTEIANRAPPQLLVDELDGIFRSFDEIITRHRIIKLKTIGDAYMAIAGVPDTSATHEVDAVLAALNLLAFVDERRALRQDPNAPEWFIRAGLHTGPLIAGMIGSRRIAYDVWGDTVNIAARLEEAATPGRLNVSHTTWSRIAPLFLGEARGEIEAKGKGRIPMYHVDRIRPEFSADDAGLRPNEAFWQAWNRLERGGS